MWASQIPVRCGSCFYPRLAGEETGQRALETCSGRPGFQEQSWVLLPAVPISPGGAAHSHVWFPRSFCGAWMLPGAPRGPGRTHSSLQRVEPPHLSLPPRLDRVEASSRRPCAVLPGPPTPHPYRPSCQYLLRSVGPFPEPKCRRAASRRERVTGASPSEKMRAVLLSLLREPGAILRLYVLRFQYLLKLKSFQDANTEERFPRIVVQVRAEARARGGTGSEHLAR